LTWQGQPLDLVRRPSGGRAVLHQGDLTYAVISSGIRGTRTEVYQTICQFLIRGWQRLGIDLHYGTAGRGYIHNPNCFGTATGADLVLADGTKLIGSAQLKRGAAVLQHGSIRLNPDLDLFSQVFGESESRLLTGLTALKDNSKLEVVEALTQAARECFGVELVEEPLSKEEMSKAGG
jgi:lipoate---protein ligase